MSQPANGHALGPTRLRPIALKDAEFLIQLRAAAAALGTLSRGATTVQAQREWLLAYSDSAARGLEHYFIITQHEQGVGAVRIYNINLAAGEFTWGSWVIQPGTAPTVAWNSAVLVYDFAFDVLNLKQANFDVVAGNSNVIRFHKSFGAAITSEGDAFVHFSLRKDDYAVLRSKFLSRLKGALASG